MIELKNEQFAVQIKEFGAEIASVKNAAGYEYFWRGDAKYWSGQAPVLFPVCGKLLDLSYRYEGKTYSMKGHGFARNKLFEARQESETCAEFTLCDDEETRAQYPFSFRLRVRYELCGNSLQIRVTVENTGDKKMYFNFGSHEAYATEGNFSDWSVELEKEEELRSFEQVGAGYFNGNVLNLGKKKELRLDYVMFENSSIAFDRIRSRTATLKHCGKPIVRVDFADFPQLLLWTKPGAPFFCIEPWNGQPDPVNTDKDITKKPMILSLEPGKSYSAEHTLHFFA